MNKTKFHHGGARPGAGRKPKPERELLRNRVVVTLTDAEFARLERAAEDDPVGLYVRRLVARHLARRASR